MSKTIVRKNESLTTLFDALSVRFHGTERRKNTASVNFTQPSVNVVEIEALGSARTSAVTRMFVLGECLIHQGLLLI